jgi:hypothetical protein
MRIPKLVITKDAAASWPPLSRICDVAVYFAVIFASIVTTPLIILVEIYSSL